jgi:hypothetical protein
MARVNTRPKTGASDAPVHEAGAVQTFSPAAELMRLVSCCLLGERQFYVNGVETVDRIKELVPLVNADSVAALAIRARTELGLRHVPLLLLREMARHGRSYLVRVAAKTVLRTPKDAMDLVALYWADGRKPLPNSFKLAIADGFGRWTDYQIAKYATLEDRVTVRLRDLARLCHPRPPPALAATFKALEHDTLMPPDTWEAALSVPGVDKAAVWTRLLTEGKLGALALVRNLRNFEQAGVGSVLVSAALASAKAADVWPWQCLAAARGAPGYAHELDALAIRSASGLPRLPGKTGVLVDVSGSMDVALAKGTMLRMDAAAGLAVVLREVCERVEIGTFSNLVCAIAHPMPRGTTLAGAILGSQPHQGTYLGAAVKAFMARFPELDRLVVLSDEQAQDRVSYPPGTPSFIINLASTQRGIAWQGKVTRIHGWSGAVVRWLALEVAQALVPAAGGEDEEGEE